MQPSLSQISLDMLLPRISLDMLLPRQKILLPTTSVLNKISFYVFFCWWGMYPPYHFNAFRCNFEWSVAYRNI